SAIVFAVIMMAGLLWNVWAFLALVSLIQVLCLREYFRLMAQIDTESYRPKWLPVTVQIVCLAWLWSLALQLTKGFALFPVFGVFPIVIILATTLSKKTGLKAGMEAI